MHETKIVCWGAVSTWSGEGILNNFDTGIWNASSDASWHLFTCFFLISEQKEINWLKIRAIGRVSSSAKVQLLQLGWCARGVMHFENPLHAQSSPRLLNSLFLMVNLFPLLKIQLLSILLNFCRVCCQLIHHYYWSPFAERISSFRCHQRKMIRQILHQDTTNGRKIFSVLHLKSRDLSTSILSTFLLALSFDLGLFSPLCNQRMLLRKFLL